MIELILESAIPPKNTIPNTASHKFIKKMQLTKISIKTSRIPSPPVGTLHGALLSQENC